MSILVLTSDTLVSPAAAGNIEYTSPIFAGTPIGTQRGIVPTQQYYRLDSALAGANATGAQSVFGVGVTLSSGTVYEFETVFALSKSAGTTSHTIAIGFGGTATLNNILTQGYMNSNTATATVGGNLYTYYITTASSTVINGGTSTASIAQVVAYKGTVSVNSGGTFIPQYTLSAAPGGAYSTLAGSFIRIAPLSASGSATNVGTWA